MNIVAVDQISDLPDEVLIHIMSLLTTKEAIQTGILAKRWRRTWASVPVLKLNFNEWIDRADIDNYEKRKECEDKFKQFVNGVLENRGHDQLDMFQYLSCIDRNYSEDSLEWLNSVVLFMPRVINVSVDRANAVDFPDSIFSCTSLQELYLDILNTNDSTVIRPELINLPSLKMLELHGVELKDDFTRKLFSGCPALECLVLGCCNLDFSDISSSALKKLVLHDCWHDKQMQISCPHMDSLVIESKDQAGGISLQNMISLVSAEFCLDMDMFDTNGAVDLLSGLSNVSTLRLDLQSTEFKVYCLLIT